MNDARTRWILGAAALVLAVTIGAIAYDVGVSHGAARMAASESAGAVTNATAPPVAPYRDRDGWRGHGWDYFPLFPLMFIFFWMFCFRLFWWGGWWGWPWYGPYSRGPRDRETFDEWHRRAHDQMKS